MRRGQGQSETPAVTPESRQAHQWQLEGRTGPSTMRSTRIALPVKMHAAAAAAAAHWPSVCRSEPPRPCRPRDGSVNLKSQSRRLVCPLRLSDHWLTENGLSKV
jgi:hypothetical protein